MSMAKLPEMKLAHVGIWVQDFERMKKWCAQILSYFDTRIRDRAYMAAMKTSEEALAGLSESERGVFLEIMRQTISELQERESS